MIRSVSGDLLAADAEALVNTVNCVGVMGKGLALAFKHAYPTNFAAYAAACRAGQVRPGAMFVHHVESLTSPRLIVNFPTKRHWRYPSRLDDVQSGLTALRRLVAEERIRSIAVPPLGCGNGGLSWGQVRQLIVSAFADAPGVDVQLFEPQAGR